MKVNEPVHFLWHCFNYMAPLFLTLAHKYWTPAFSSNIRLGWKWGTMAYQHAYWKTVSLEGCHKGLLGNTGLGLKWMSTTNLLVFLWHCFNYMAPLLSALAHKCWTRMEVTGRNWPTTGAMSFSKTTLSLTAFSIMTLRIMTLSIMTLSIMTFSTILNKTRRRA